MYLDLERPFDRLRLEDADTYLRAQQGKLVILDEMHRAPGVFMLARDVDLPPCFFQNVSKVARTG